MFGSYILHVWTKPYLTRENIPQTFFDIVNADGADVSDLASRMDERVVLLSVCGCIFARVLVGQIRDKKVLKMIENAQSRLVRYVFDYNLLEAISIVVSTSILLVGMVCYRIPLSGLACSNVSLTCS